MPRAFFGIAMPAAAQAGLVCVRNAFLEVDPAWAGEKWVDPHNLHMTLLFLGEISAAELDHAADLARNAMAGAAPYDVRLDGLRAVPRPGRASMIWATLAAGEDPTRDLAARIASACVQPVEPADDRTFRAHVTLCRARRPRPIASPAIDVALRRLRDHGPAMNVSVGAVTLFTSTLTRRGPIYDEHAIIPLGR